jgi:hypothetical protein
MSVETTDEIREGIREQAEKLGYIVKQKGRLYSSPGSTVCHEHISHGDPWHITSNSGEFGSRGRRFWSRPFDTEEDAVAGLSEVLRDDARSRALDNYDLRITPWEDGNFGLGSDKICLPVGPHKSVGAALDVAEEAVRERIERDQRAKASRLALRLAAHQRNMPPAFLAFPEDGADLLFGLALPVDLLDSTTSNSRQQLRNSGRNDLVAASQPCS